MFINNADWRLVIADCCRLAIADFRMEWRLRDLTDRQSIDNRRATIDKSRQSTDLTSAM
jgi:hypothetical protein